MAPHKNLRYKASCRPAPTPKFGKVRHPRRFRPGSKYIPTP
jgi:histone H3